MLNGWLNEVFVPNCRICRDEVGNFCSEPAQLNVSLPTALTCHSITLHECPTLNVKLPANTTPASLLAEQEPWSGDCPANCLQCPGYVAHAESMFMIVLLMALSTPIVLTAILPFLRGTTSRAPSPSSTIHLIALLGSDLRPSPASGHTCALALMMKTLLLLQLAKR